MTEGTEQPLGYLLNRVAVALRAEVTTSVLEPLGLTFPQYVCMRVLSWSPGRSNAELARNVGVSPQAMNMVVRGLQDRELVTRPASVTAGRSLPAELTREGVALLKRTDPGLREAEARIMAPITAQDRRTFRRILDDLG